MNEQLELSAEQVINAIQQLDPAEKAKVQQQLPRLFNIPEHIVYPEKDAVSPVAGPVPTYQYTFTKVRHLLREVPGSLGEEVIAAREERF
jgi:hypothetical protein